MNPEKDSLAQRWTELETKLIQRFGKKPDLNAILLLIGVQESGQVRSRFSKEEKQDLMHVAVCHLLSGSGYYELEKVDADGWPHYRQLKALPNLPLPEQEDFLKDHILLYFHEMELQ